MLGRHTDARGEDLETAADAQRALERPWSPGLRHLRAVYEVDGEWYRDTYAVVEGDYRLKHDRPIIGHYFSRLQTYDTNIGKITLWGASKPPVVACAK